MLNVWEENNENNYGENMDEQNKSLNKQKKGVGENEFASRARNRTVMLTPEMTGIMRAKMKGVSATQQIPFMEDGNNEVEFSASEIEEDGVVNKSMQEMEEDETEEKKGKNIQKSKVKEEKKMSNRDSEGIEYVKLTPIAGFLISFDNDENGEVFLLRTGRIIVSSEKNGSGNCLYLKDESVSPMHAVLRVGQSGDVQVLDQLSEYGTKIKRINSEDSDKLDEIELSGEKSVIKHRDVICFGKRKFIVSLF